MSTDALVLLSNLGTLAISLLAVVFATGRLTGEVRRDLSQIKHDIAQIQGMFVTRLRSDRIDKGD